MSPAGYESAVSAGGQALAGAFLPDRLPSFLEIQVEDLCNMWACTLICALNKNLINYVV
jgi:hypothetical protein